MTQDGAALLAAFLKDNGITRNAAAAALGATRTALYYWLTRQTVPSEQGKLDIEVWTGGKVPASSWPTADRRKAGHEVKPFAGGGHG